ncbi:RhoGEF domain protein [Ceratobasidium sp. AG-Ba]|nr:RhoGEF domain protein [Ceratobasidium sp. AG-Ba]
MATLAPRPGPAIIQRANSLQASDTSHTSTASSTASTTDASTNTSASHSKPSPVSSIGESISSVVHQPLQPIPPARNARPLPIPPTLSPPLSPGLTSTSTLKLSHQESHSTLGKSSQANLQKPTSSSTLPLTKSKNVSGRKLSRTRLDTNSPVQPPPSAFTSRRMSDDGWVSVSVMPVLAERQPDGHTHEPNLQSYARPASASSAKRSASAVRGAKSPQAEAPTSVSAKSAARTASKSLPRLPQSEAPVQRRLSQPQDNAWKLEFRGVVRLVRWVSRRDRDKRESAVEDVNENESPDQKHPEDEKLVVEETQQLPSRRGFSISSEAKRRTRDSYNQPAPRPNAPSGGLGPVRARPLSIVRPHPKLEGESDANAKRRLTKSNPGLVNFALGSTLADRTSTDISQRTRTSTDTGMRASVDAGRRTSSDAGHGLGISPNGGGVFIPDVPLSIPVADAYPPRTSSLAAATSILPTFDTSIASPNGVLSVHPETSADLSQSDRFGEGDDTITFLPAASFSSLPHRQGPISPSSPLATLTRTTTTQTTTTTTTTQTVVQASPFSITSPQSSLPATTHTHALSTTHSTLSPVLEVPLFTSELVASPPDLGAVGVGGFPWSGANGGVVQVGEIVPSGSVIFRGGVEAAAATQVSTVQIDGAQVETVVTEVVGTAPISAVEAFANSLSPAVASSVSPISSGSLSPLADTLASVSPLMSTSISPLMSNVASASTSPVMHSNSHLPDPYILSHTPATAASSLSYTTARSNRNSLPAAQAIFDGHNAAALQVTVDPVMFDQSGMSNEASYMLRAGASTDIGHGCSTRAVSPAPSDRYAFSEDPHSSRTSGGILRTLSSIGHSDAPLPMPRRPFMDTRGSSGSVTFDDSSTQSSPRIGGRRKMMTMSASDIRQSDRFSSLFGGGNQYANVRSPRPEVHRSKSSLSITGRIIRRLSIGSSSNVAKPSGADSEAERPRIARKLTRRKSHGRSASASTVSLPYTAGQHGVPPVPPLPPGVSSGKFFGRAQSEIGHGAPSDVGHGVQSEIGHGYTHSRGGSFGGHSTWGGSTSALGHGSMTSHMASPAPTRVSFRTTHSAPATNGRNKLVKKQKQARRMTDADMPGRSLASLQYPSEPVSRDPPRITTEFAEVSLSMNGHSMSAGTEATTEDGHLMPPRPGMPRRTSSQRRWTIADIDDDEFLRQLEVRLSGSGSRYRKSRMLEDYAMGADQSRESHEDEPDPGSETDDSTAAREWDKARRAMMCVREIVRTEKSYLRHMMGFLGGDQSIMSPILLEHLPRLIETSRMLTARLEEDPTAWGVSKAFLDVEEQLEAALVEWSGVVGHVVSSRSSRGESQATSEDGHTSSAGSGSAASSWIRRRSATASSSSTQPFQLNLSMTPVIGSKDKKSNRVAKSKRLTEQDVAIMPTQRVLRYVLLYRELLVYTPVKSASRPLVERALEGATRIAQRCDEAQTHIDMLSPS